MPLAENLGGPCILQRFVPPYPPLRARLAALHYYRLPFVLLHHFLSVIFSFEVLPALLFGLLPCYGRRFEVATQFSAVSGSVKPRSGIIFFLFFSGVLAHYITD